MIRIRGSILKSMGIYTASNLVNAGIPFFLLPFLTQYLSPEDYGILSNFNAFAQLLIPFVGINLMSSVQIQYLKSEIDNKDYISTGVRFNVFLAAIFSVIIFLSSPYLEFLTGVPAFYLSFLGIYAFSNVVIEVLLAIWRMEDKPIFYGVFRISRTAIEVSLIIFFVVAMGLNFEGSIYGMMIAYVLGLFAALLILTKKKLLFGTQNKSYLRHAINYGVPLIPHALSGIIIMFSDKLILTYYHGLSVNGVYSVGFLIGQAIGLLQNSFNQAWLPWVFQRLKSEDEQSKYKMVKVTYLYFVGILGAVLILWLLTPFVFSMLGKEFRSGMSLVLWVGLGFAFNGMYKMVSVYIFYAERTKLIASMSFMAATINLILNFALIPKYSAEGAAFATLIAMFIQFVLTWWLSTKVIKLPWNLK